MHSARIKLPASFKNSDIANLCTAFEDDTQEGTALAVSAIRDNHKKDTDWTLEWIFETTPDIPALTNRLELQAAVFGIDTAAIKNAVWEIAGVPEKNWLLESYKQFPAFSIPPFFIYGAHHEGNVPNDLIGLQIDAATAFGSGEHATTAGCLQAMKALETEGVCPWNVLDMGTGSGILAVAAWKLWKTMILAVDIDQESVNVSVRHRDLNKVPDGATGMTCVQGDGFRVKVVKERGPYDLIIANILAGPLIEMAHDLKKVSDENGFVILSGMLNEQADSVLSVYEAEDFILHNRLEIDEWTTLVLRNAL